MENEKQALKKKKYRTHPIVGACLLLLFTVSLLSVGGAYLVYRYSDGVVAEYERKCADTRYEAFLSFREEIFAGDTTAAMKALSRYALFSGEDLDRESISVLEDFLSAGNMTETEKEKITLILSSDLSAEEMMAALAALLSERDGYGVNSVSETENLRGGREWMNLRERGEVTESEAKAEARRFIGGGVTLSAADNHTFPLVYFFSCDNAAAEVTRMGGRLFRMWIYRDGELSERSLEECRCAAREFVYETGIRGAYLLYEENDGERINYVFVGTSRIGDEEAVFGDERVEVTVDISGARISGYDASEYYRNRGVYTEMKRPEISRARAMAIAASAVEENGGNGAEIRLYYVGGKLFWRAGGEKILYIDAENGSLTVQNP